MRLVPASLALALSLVAAPAAAQSAIVLTPAAPEDTLDRLERARAGVIETLAERGVRLVRPGDGSPCEEVACATALAAEAAVEWVLLLRVEAAEDGAPRVRLIAASADAPPDEQVEPVGDAGAAAAASAALDALLDRAAGRQQGFLLVTTDPPGARVEIDGEVAGAGPLRRMVAPGEHTVRMVPAEGDPVERTVEVRPLAETAVALAVAPVDDDARDAPSPGGGAATRTEPSPFNWMIGGGLAIAGVITLLSPLQTIAQHGECVDELENVGCVERVQFGAQSGVLLGIGVALLAAAVIVDVVAPIRVTVQVSESAGGVSVGGRF